MAVKRALMSSSILVILQMMVEIMNLKGSADMVPRKSDGADITQELESKKSANINASCEAISGGEYLHVQKPELCRQGVQKTNARSDQDRINPETYISYDSDGFTQPRSMLYRTGRRARPPTPRPWRTFRHNLAKMRNSNDNHNNRTRRSTNDGRAALGQSRPSDDEGGSSDDDSSALGSIWELPAPLYLDENLDAYYVNMKVGTPPVDVRFYPDTFTRLSHMPCLDPLRPLQTINVPAHGTVFDSSQSSTYSKFDCGTDCNRLTDSAGCLDDYEQCGFRLARMPDPSQVVRGRVGMDRFTLDNNAESAEFMFGCTLPPRLPRPRAVLGLGTGLTSFTEQTVDDPGCYWCAPPNNVAYGLLGLGLPGFDTDPDNSMQLPMSPMNPYENGVTLTNVKIDGVNVEVWQGFRNNGPTMYFNLDDTNTQITQFLYLGFLQDFHAAAGRRGLQQNIAAGDACYDLPADADMHPDTNNIPNISFHFSGDASLTFTNTKVLTPDIAAGPPANPNLRAYCLPIQPTLSPNTLSVFLGQFQMEGLLVQMDNLRRRITLTPDYCVADQDYDNH